MNHSEWLTMAWAMLATGSVGFVVCCVAGFFVIRDEFRK